MHHLKNLVDEKLIEPKGQDAMNRDYMLWYLGFQTAPLSRLDKYLERHSAREFTVLGFGDVRGLAMLDDGCKIGPILGGTFLLANLVRLV